MRLLSPFPRLVRTLFIILSVVWLWCCVSVNSYAQAQPDMVWEQTNGPEGGYINCIAVSETSVFVGMFVGGIYRSMDNGASWTALNIGNSVTSFYAIAASGNTVFAATHKGIYRSLDNGTSWTAVNTGLTNVNSLLITGGSTIFAGTTRGVFRSTDNGTSWIAVNTGLTSTNVLSLSVIGNTIFGATANGAVIRSADNGTSWTAVNIGLRLNYGLVSNIFAAVGNTLFVGEGEGVFRSTDNGASWTATNNVPPLIFVRSLVANGNTLFVGTQDFGVYRSTDNGASWVAANIGLPATNVQALGVNGTTVFAGTFGGGLFRSLDNGASWTAANTGLKNGSVDNFGTTSLTVSAGTLFAQTRGGSMFRSTDNGTSWTAANIGLMNANMNYYSLVKSGNILFAGASNSYNNRPSDGVLFRSTDNGASWNTVNLGLTGIGSIRDLTANNGSIFAATDSGIVRSTDNGVSWAIINNALKNTNALALAVSNGTLFAGTAQNGVFRSMDNGTSWAAVNNGLVLGQGGVRFFAVSGSTIFAIMWNQGGAFRSTDNGASWTAIGIPGFPLQNIYFLTVSGNTIFASVDGRGVFRSTDNGNSWTAVNTGLTDLSITSLAVSGTTLFAGTGHSGVFRSTIPVLPASLSATPNILNLDTLGFGSTSNKLHQYTLTGQNLLEPVVITAPAGVLLFNAANGTWTNSLTLTPSVGSIAEVIRVRLDSSQARTINGAILNVSASAMTNASTQASVRVSGVVQRPPILLTTTPEYIMLDTIVRSTPSPQKSYNIVGANLAAPVIITAPEGILLLNTATSTWVRSLTLATNATGSVMQTISVRLDSSVTRTISDASILHTSSSTQASVRVSGVVRHPPAQLTVIPEQISLDTIIHFDPSSPQEYTITGTNLTAPVVITAPEGILLFNAATSTWVRSLTFATSATASVMQTIAVRLDSSQLRSIVNQDITHESVGTQTTVQVSGAVVLLSLPTGAETTLEMRLVAPRPILLIRDTARVQLWLKDSRLLTPRLINRFVKNLRVTLKLDTNNFNIVGVAASADTRVRFETAPQLPRISPFTTILIDRIDTTTTREMLLAELLVQAAVGATTTNTVRAAQPTEWIGTITPNTPPNTARITWGIDSLRLEIRPLFAPRRQTALTAVVAPNPSNGEMELSYTLSPTTQGVEPLMFIVSDMAGRIIHQQELGKRRTGETQRETVNLRGLAAGSYQVLLVSSAEVLLGRVDIMR